MSQVRNKYTPIEIKNKNDYNVSFYIFFISYLITSKQLLLC
jgi:hypothetical protein